MNENLENALNINPPEVKEGEVMKREPTQIKVTDEMDAHRKQIDRRADYATVRDNLKNIIDSGMNAIDGILSVASEGESPRAYEVVSQLIKSVSDANKDLIGLHQQMKELEKELPSQSAGSITNNSIFVGSTKELQQLVKSNWKELKAQQDNE
jgi:hypothetical protein